MFSSLPQGFLKLFIILPSNIGIHVFSMVLINEIYIDVDLLLPGHSYENMGKLKLNLLRTSNRTTNKAEQIHVLILWDTYIHTNI